MQPALQESPQKIATLDATEPPQLPQVNAESIEEELRI
jgi:hypothetical protein